MRVTKTQWIIAGVVALLLVFWFTKERFTAAACTLPAGAPPCTAPQTAKTQPDGSCKCA